MVGNAVRVSCLLTTRLFGLLNEPTMGATELKPLHPVAQTLEAPAGGLRSFPPADR